MSAMILCGDALTVLQTLPDKSVQMCCTSPPYWGLRDYGMEGQLGLERSPEEYVAKLVAVFREVRRVLKDDGCLWLNLGDSYAGSGKGGNPEEGKQATNKGSQSIGVLYGKTGETARQAAVTNVSRRFTAEHPEIKAKDLVGIPWMMAFALRADGWYLRQEVIWNKPNAMPESVQDRCTRSHEQVFMLSKQGRYFYNAEAIAEPTAPDSHTTTRQERAVAGQRSVPTAERNGIRPRHPDSAASGLLPPPKQDGHGRRHAGFNGRYDFDNPAPTRNARSVWTIATQPYAAAHFATFPEELARRCIMAGSRPGDTVLDPFSGSGTVGQVATGNGREAVLIELNPAYIELARQRIGPMLCA